MEKELDVRYRKTEKCWRRSVSYLLFQLLSSLGFVVNSP